MPTWSRSRRATDTATDLLMAGEGTGTSSRYAPILWNPRARKRSQRNFRNGFVEVGVAEQNMAAIAAGLGVSGKIPFIASYATFSPGRNWEQIRTTIAYNDANVKIAGHHAGISVGPDGATHQATEDIADDARDAEHESVRAVRCD